MAVPPGRCRDAGVHHRSACRRAEPGFPPQTEQRGGRSSHQHHPRGHPAGCDSGGAAGYGEGALSGASAASLRSVALWLAWQRRGYGVVRRDRQQCRGAVPVHQFRRRRQIRAARCGFAGLSPDKRMAGGGQSARRHCSGPRAMTAPHASKLRHSTPRVLGRALSALRPWRAGDFAAAGRVLRGIRRFNRVGVIPDDARAAALELHCHTNGRFTRGLASALRVLHRPQPPRPVAGILGDLAVAEQNRIAAQLRRDGFYVFDARLPPALCDEIEGFANATPAIIAGREVRPDRRRRFDPAAPEGKKYYFAEDELVANRGMQRLMGDPMLLAVAERYLATPPVLSDVTLWWSGVHAGTPEADAGQSFHFDFDTPPGWMMFFFYLTDVGPE